MAGVRIVVASTNAALAEMCRAVASAENGFEVAAEVNDLSRIAGQVRSLRPEVLLLDTGLTDDPEILSRVRELNPETRILLIADRSDFGFVMRMLEHGAQGCVSQDCPPESLVKAIHALRDGELWASRRAVSRLIEVLLRRSRNLVARHSNPGIAALTGREQEIVEWVSRGMTNKEIGRRLGISDLTVKSHLQHIYAKLGVHCRLQVVMDRATGTR